MSGQQPLATRPGTTSEGRRHIDLCAGAKPSFQKKTRWEPAGNSDAREDNVNEDESKPTVCPTCGAVTTATGHLCRPFESTQPHVCEYCGAETDDPRHMCYPQIEHLAYQCRHCGRLAAKAEALCHPKRIAGTS